MTSLLMILAMAAAPAPEADRLPPKPDQPPSLRDLPQTDPSPAIFTYTVDGQCRVADSRKLQGPYAVSWDDAQRRLEVFHETTVWRFLDRTRTQLRERRVKLLGEMVLAGELVCRVLPSEAVVEAWIEREDRGSGRRRAPTREPVPVREGEIENLGTFSLDFLPDQPAR